MNIYFEFQVHIVQKWQRYDKMSQFLLHDDHNNKANSPAIPQVCSENSQAKKGDNSVKNFVTITFPCHAGLSFDHEHVFEVSSLSLYGTYCGI